MRTKSFAVRASGKCLDPSHSLGVENIESEAAAAASDEGRRRDKRHCLGRASETTVGGGRVNLEACIFCDVSDDGVNRCNGSGCILLFHRECAEFGNPYCPYCWFKIVNLKSKSLREEATVAEKEASKDLSKERKGTDDDDVIDTTFFGDENGNHEPMDICSSEDEQVDVVGNNDSGQTRQENTQPIHDEEMNLKDFEDVETANVDKDAGEKRSVSSFLSMQDLLSEEGQKNEKQNSRKRRLLLNDADSELSTNEGNGKEFTTSSTQVTSATTKSKPGRDVEFFKKNQQRRQFWTVKEEEMLELGVEKFAAEANKNMPWKKILEWGEQVFHDTRAPSDLKDKWRNMCRKAT